MRIAVLGVGAMGSIYAALLASAGHEVWAVDPWAEHVEAIRARGLRVEGASGDRTVRLHATTTASDVREADLAVIATKSFHVESAAHDARAMLKEGAPVVTIQNGVGSAERVAGVLGAERVIVGVVGGFGASMRGPGHAHHNGWEFLNFGELTGARRERTEAVAEAWRGAGFKVKVYDDIERMIWEKLICNVAFSGCCCLTGLRIGEVLATPSAWRVASACASEAYAVARAKGVALPFADPIAHALAFGGKIPNARPSMLLDHLAGRRCEIDAINGAVPRLGGELGVATPVNATVSDLVRAREAAFPPA